MYGVQLYVVYSCVWCTVRCGIQLHVVYSCVCIVCFTFSLHPTANNDSITSIKKPSELEIYNPSAKTYEQSKNKVIKFKNSFKTNYLNNSI